MSPRSDELVEIVLCPPKSAGESLEETSEWLCKSCVKMVIWDDLDDHISALHAGHAITVISPKVAELWRISTTPPEFAYDRTGSMIAHM